MAEDDQPITLARLGATPSIDVLISTYNEQVFIGRCLDSVLGQSYQDSKVRVWLIDGGSTDGTVAIAAERAKDNGRLTVIAKGHRLNLPEALNLGVLASEAELIAKVDAHGYLDRHFLSKAVDALRSEPEAACVGGRPEQRGQSRFGRALALARTSRFGVGASVYAGKRRRELVDTVQCGVYRREPLVGVGAFDPAMAYGEDEELNWRLRKAGFRIVLDSDIRFTYITRASWRAAYRQYRNYGEARIRVVLKHPDFLRPHHLAPAGFVVALASLAAAAPRSSAARRMLTTSAAGYLAASAGAAARASRRGSPRLLPWVIAAFAALHLGYGVGMVEGAGRAAAALGRRRRDGLPGQANRP